MSLLDTASLIVTPNGYKEGKLYSVIPSDGSGDLSVTRATTATRVNSQGLVELVPYNLLRYSEQFDNAAWAKETTVTVTPNVEIAPDGTLTADLINMPINRSMFQTFSIPAGEAATASVYIKGTAGETINFAVKSQNFTRVLTGEWQRIEATSSGSGTIFSVNRYSGGTASSFYLWGYQLNEGSTALPYQKTETRLNIPRLDYSNGTCPSILVEPQRTNSCLYSENISTGWTYTNTGILLDQTASPSGVANADAIIPNATSGQHAINSTNITASGSFTLSAFVKAGEYTKVAIRESANTGSYASFNLATGTKIEDNVSGASFIESYENGWYRIGVTGTFSGNVRLGINVLSNAYTTGNPSSGTTFFSGNASDKLFCWGMQCELGATYATSYIPTTSASVTRNADVISKTGISSLIGQTEGTLFVDIFADAIATLARGIMYASDGTTNNRVAIQYDSAGNLQAIASSGGTTQGWVVYSYSGNAKIAFAYNSTNYELFVNGVSRGTFVGSLPITLDRLDLGSVITVAQMGGIIKAAAIWKTRLTNDQLATLTTI